MDTAAVRELLAKAFKHAASSHNGKVAAAAGGAGLYFIKVCAALTRLILRMERSFWPAQLLN